MAEYFPCVEHAEKVRSCVRAGIVSNERIAKLVGITQKQLEENYPYELGYSDDEELAIVANVAYEMATSGKFPHMTQYWLKCKGGHMWQEKKTMEIQSTSPLVVVIRGSDNENNEDNEVPLDILPGGTERLSVVN